MLIGYVRSLPGEEVDLDAHCQGLTDAGCEQIVMDTLCLDGTDGQPELQVLLGRLRPVDVVVVPELDRLAGSPANLVRWVQRLASAGVGLRSLAEALDITALQSGLVAPDGSQDVTGDGYGSVRSVSGFVPVVHARRRLGGRPPKLSREQQKTLTDEVLSGRHTAVQMARRFRVSEATVSRMLAARRAAASLPSPVTREGGDVIAADRVLGVLPPSALDERLAIVGTSGSGKTYAAKGLLERVMARGGRACVVDPLGVWWGLAKGVDGVGPPFPVAVFGGAHGDLALDPGMGAALGRLVGTQSMACVVDVSDFGSAASRRAFMTAFTETLYAANTKPLHLVLDEADLWAPQRTQPDGMELLGRVEEIVRRGRVRGFVPWLITQRPAVLHKDVLSQADVLVSMKLTSSQDRAAVGRWIEGQADRAEGRRILGALPQLRRGEGWVWAPGDGVLARVTFPRIHTLDSSQTPRREITAGSSPPLPPVDLTAIARALARIGVNGDE